MADPRRRTSLAALALLLTAFPPARLAAQTISVVAARGFRPTAVLLPHVRYIIKTDSTDGAAIISELAVPPVAFAGSIRVEGVQPGARAPEARPFGDTVHFDADGRAQLLVADAAGRPALAIDVSGSRGAPAGRINIVAHGWPLGRIMLVTIAPADLYELNFQHTGLGVRDRTRVDDRTGFAYLADSSAGPTTVAIGFGRGTRGRIQADQATVVLSRDFGGQVGQERRIVGALSLVVDPARDDDGTARAEIIFGVGNSEDEATRAAHAASDEPAATPRASALRWSTPVGEVDLLPRHLLAVAGWMLDWELPAGERAIPSSAARPMVRAVDAWLGAPVALQRGDTAAVCGSYRLLRGTGATPHTAIALRLGRSGRTLTSSDSTSPSTDAALLLLGQACYQATRNAAMRRRESSDSLLAAAALLFQPTPARSPSERWSDLVAAARRGVSREFGRLSDGDGAEIGGLSMPAAGRFIDQMVGGVFGVREYLDRLEIAPQLGGIADDHAWQLDGWLLSGGDTLGLTYRPAARSVVIRLTASQRHRVVLRFPWLAATSCVAVRRGPDAERLGLVAQSDGSFFIDVRAFFDPAVITVSAEACAGP